MQRLNKTAKSFSQESRRDETNFQCRLNDMYDAWFLGVLMLLTLHRALCFYNHRYINVPMDFSKGNKGFIVYRYRYRTGFHGS